MTIQDQLIDIVVQMKRGDYSPPCAATLITEDEETGIMTIVSMGVDGNDGSHQAFHKMAQVMGYSKVN